MSITDNSLSKDYLQPVYHTKQITDSPGLVLVLVGTIVVGVAVVVVVVML